MIQTILQNGKEMIQGPTLSALFNVIQGEMFSSRSEHQAYLSVVEKDFGYRMEGEFELLDQKGRVLRRHTLIPDPDSK